MIILKTEKEIEIMRDGGKILAEVLKQVSKEVRPGVTTDYLNKAAKGLVLSFGAKPAFENYMGFPATLCTSINDIIVHGVPDEIKLKEGDIVSLDLGLIYKGFYSDMAITIPVGKISKKAEELIEVTRESLNIAIKHTKPGIIFGDIGSKIQEYIEKHGFGVVRDLCGHGIGRNLHEDPQILNYGKKGTGFEIKEGMVLCIEPMVTEEKNKWQIRQENGEQAFKTMNGLLSAHFEHTIAVLKDRAIILTKI